MLENLGRRPPCRVYTVVSNEDSQTYSSDGCVAQPQPGASWRVARLEGGGGGANVARLVRGSTERASCVHRNTYRCTPRTSTWRRTRSSSTTTRRRCTSSSAATASQWQRATCTASWRPRCTWARRTTRWATRRRYECSKKAFLMLCSRQSNSLCPLRLMLGQEVPSESQRVAL